MTRQRTPRGAAAVPVTSCDGPCGEPNQASWLTLYGMGAYCRQCLPALLAADRENDRRVADGEADAVAEAMDRTTNYIESPRPYSRSALIVRGYFGLEDHAVRVS
jgi:hypothetical protein